MEHRINWKKYKPFIEVTDMDYSRAVKISFGEKDTLLVLMRHPEDKRESLVFGTYEDAERINSFDEDVRMAYTTKSGLSSIILLDSDSLSRMTKNKFISGKNKRWK